MGNQQVKEKRDYVKRIDWETAECPSPPGKPYLVPETNERFADIITIRWAPPSSNGGIPIIGYIVEHRRTGSPHWLRATPHLIRETELPLTGLEPGWRYQFRVTAENEVGRSSFGDVSEPLTVSPHKSAASAPFFNIELQDKSGLENEKVEFKVHVIGVPTPTIAWYKDGFEVFSSRRTKIVTEDDHSTFIIHQAALEDEGEIKCTATNRAGHAVTKAILKLEAPPRIRLPRQYEDGLIFEKGDSIRLKATVAGRPIPEVTWYHNGEIIRKNERIDIVHSKTGSMLKIREACRSDRGEYSILGINKIGDDMTSFLVTVTDRPSPPGKIKVERLGRKVNLTWLAPEDDGGCKIGTYIIEYFRVGWDMWLKARNSRQLSTSLENLIEGSQYKFRVRAENPYGISEPSEESEFIFVPDARRGLLTPPVVKSTSPAVNETKSTLKKKCGAEIPGETEEAKRRRLLEEKARKLLDTPLSQLLPYENTSPDKKRRAESSSESIPFSEGSDSIPPTVPRRKNKGKKRINLNSSSSDIDERQKLTPSPGGRSSDYESSGQDINIKSTKLLDVKKQKLEKPLLKIDKVRTEENDLYTDQSPLYPRETDDSIIHGSSELMLVIYPRDRSKSVELSSQQRSEIELHLRQEGVAPPMSLSSPELSSTEGFELPPLRDAVSSTELLYERTAARLYQDAIEEESQGMVKRRYSTDKKSIERRASFKEQILERRRSFRENDNKIQESKPKENEIQTTNEDLTKDDHLTLPLNNRRSNLSKERLSSVEKENLEFAAVRERLRQKEENNRLKALSIQQLSDTTTTTSSSIDTDDVEEQEEDEDEDGSFYINKNSYFNTDGFFLLNDPKTKPSNKPSLLENETYHPRNMVPTRSILSKLEIVGDSDPKSPSQPCSPQTAKKETVKKEHKKKDKGAKILKKFGLKKDKSITEVTPVDQNATPQPKPILKNKQQVKVKTSPMRRLNLIPSRTSEKSVSEEESENENLGKKKKVRITEPNVQEDAAKVEEEKKVDMNAVENQVLISHYSHIVQEFGGHRRPSTRLFLNYDELKAQATVQGRAVRGRTAVDSADKPEIQKPPDKALEKKSEEPPALKMATERKPSEVKKPQSKFHMSFDYATDIAMFLLACWLYFFKNELYAIPVLCVMAYRQLKDMAVEKYKKFNKFTPQVVSDNTQEKPKPNEHH
ncbi:hypothetical protein RUM44_009970 [Polyplax serrata]|uniref:Titin n=1 Tax=Polyplax serrata TaxID=468196 RepID=A0ABR1AU69_POLSC